MSFLASRWVLGPLCVVAFGILCWDASSRLVDDYPPLYVCRQDPLKYEGKPVWMSPSPVMAVGRGFFTVDHFGETVRVTSPTVPETGALVMVYGTFRSDGTVEAASWQIELHYRMKRRGVIVISFFVLAIGVVIFHRTFAWRAGAFYVRQSSTP